MQISQRGLDAPMPSNSCGQVNVLAVPINGRQAGVPTTVCTVFFSAQSGRFTAVGEQSCYTSAIQLLTFVIDKQK